MGIRKRPKNIPSSIRLSAARKAELRLIEQQLEDTTNYAQWAVLARAHDKISGAEQWRRSEDRELYDAVQVRARFDLLRELCDGDDLQALLFALNEGIHGNMGGMGKATLYGKTMFGTKQLIGDYVNVVIEALHRVYDAPVKLLSKEDKLDFFRRARHCYGSSSLSLSGGAGLIYFHHGVVDTLLEQELLPNVLSGSSAGSWMCAQIGMRTNEELVGYFESKRYTGFDNLSFSSMLQLAKKENVEAARDGVIDDFIDNTTFQEAFEHTGRYINVSIAPAEKHQTPRLMNAITSPNVTISSAVKASSAVPGVSSPVKLEAKDWRGKIKPYLANRRWVDGSMSNDIPAKQLARLFGVNHNIVSMINPLALNFVKDNNVSDENIRQSAARMFYSLGKEWLKNSERLIAMAGADRTSETLATIYGMIDQDYTGDINIILKTKDFRWANLAFHFPDETEIVDLIDAGRRSTFTKVEMIRNTSAIGKEIDSLLQNLERQGLRKQTVLRKAHMTVA